MDLTASEVDGFLVTYYTALIGDEEERGRMIERGRRMVERSRDRLGRLPPSLRSLQQILGNFLDHQQYGDFGSYMYNGRAIELPYVHMTISLDAALRKADRRKWIDIIFSIDKNLLAINEDEDDSEQILEQLREQLTPEQYETLLKLARDEHNLVYSLRERLGIEAKIDVTQVADRVEIFSDLPANSRLLQAAFMEFQQGRRRYNPLQRLDEQSAPVIGILLDKYEKLMMTTGAGPFLHNLGFATLVRNHPGSVTDLVFQTQPELVATIPHLRKWSHQSSVQRVVDLISKALYEITGYQEAEEGNDRDKLVTLINGLIDSTPSLKQYFVKRGLRQAMAGFYDPDGIRGFRRTDSGLAVLEFYDQQKGHGLFDRTQQTYVKRWKIRQETKWQQGKESVQLALEAIADVLYEIPKYREAEKAGNRKEEIRIINKFCQDNPKLLEYFRNHGLNVMMQTLIDPTGRMGMKRTNSPAALLQFYSAKKGLKWFVRQKPYLTADARGRVKYIP